eukprot:gene942-1194_t
MSMGLFLILLPLKLDGTDIHWAAVMVPFWVVLLLLTLARDDEDRRFEISKLLNILSSENGDSGAKIRAKREVRYTGHSIKSEAKMYQVFLPNFVLSLAGYTVLEVVHRSVDSVDLSWSIRFIPFFYFIGLTLLFIASVVKVKWPIFIPLFISTFLVLLYLYGMNYIPYLAVVFIPIYISELILFFVGYYVLLFTSR